jgi:xanthine dehydrogenase molybdopterin-binding subunit B
LDASRRKLRFCALQKEADEFNLTNKFIKKGVAMQPVCFGIFVHQNADESGALARHVYTDGSVAFRPARWKWDKA